MTNFWQALELVDQTPPVEIEYKLYYDQESGEALFYTTECVEGTYITVDKQVFAEGRYDVTVKNNIIVKPDVTSYIKLVPNDTGIRCHPTNVMIIDSNSNKHWSKKQYVS